MKKKAFYSFLIAFLLLITVIIINKRSFNGMQEYTTWVNHSREVITSLEKLSNHFKSAQIYTPTHSNGKENFYSLYKAETLSIPGELKNLKDLVKDNPQQTKRINLLSDAIGVHLDVLLQKNIVELIQAGDVWRLEKFFQIHAMISNTIAAEQQLLTIREKELKKSTRLTGILTLIFSVSAVLLILITFFSNILLIRRRIWLEGFLESVLNTSQNGIVTYKAVRKQGKIIDFKISFANNAIEKLLGIKPENVIGKRLQQIPSFVSDSDDLFNKYVSVVETGNQLEFETLYNKGDIQKWFFVLLGRLEDGLTATFHDISSIKHYENELKNNIQQLQESNEELEQYAYAASHDLQEPLRKIRTFGSLLEETQTERLDPKGKEQLGKILNAAERMGNLIKDILEFSGIKKESDYVPTDLNNIVTTVLQDLELLIAQKQAVIKHDPLPVIEAIPLQMNQLFYNLVNNALKFTRESTTPLIEIHCRTLSVEETKKYIIDPPHLVFYQITIKDNGIGFNDKFSEQIFGMFKRLGDKKDFPGSGIGLALCRKVVANHRGFIFAEGAENEGASFNIILPAKHIQ